MEITPSDFKNILTFIIKNYKIEYADFTKSEFQVYKKKKIVGFVRFDKKEIFFDKDICNKSNKGIDNKVDKEICNNSNKGICNKVEVITWAHEALSIYYYQILKIIRHDNEIEEQARALCDDLRFYNLIREYINKLGSS